MNTFTHLQSESRSITDSASSLTSISPSSINCRSPIMADALINLGVELAWIAERYIEQKVRLVVGVKKEIKKLESTLQTILAVLNDAEKRQIKEEPVRLWLEKVKDISYDADDLFAEWTTVILKRQIESTAVPKQKVCFYIFSCLCFNRGVDREVIHRHDIAHKIQAINERLDEIATEKDRYNFITNPAAGEDSERYKGTVSFVVVSQVRGRDQDLNNLVNKLLCEETNQADGSPHIISVVGMGGIGKTTLAQLAYNCAEIKAHFDITMWVCVSTPFDQIRIAKAIVEDVDGNAPNNVELEPVLRRVRNLISEKKFLLVLDDVWSEDPYEWEPLKNSLTTGARGSKILVTTRNERVAVVMGTKYTIGLGLLSNEDCWTLFSHIAFYERSREDTGRLGDIGRRIADKCKGLPLAAKILGSLMRLKKTIEDWQNVLDSELVSLFHFLLLSYYDLPSAMKRCFSYCAVFPKDHKIEADNLIKLWMAQGYLSSGRPVIEEHVEIKGREYLENLVMRSFFQDIEKDKEGGNIVRFKMHDMVHDFAQFLTKKECFIVKVDSGIEPRLDSETIRHLTLIRAEEAPFPVPTDYTDKLHTFWVQSFYDCPPIVSERDIVPSDLFHRLTCLRALDLSRNRLDELPREVGKLIILKYLNLSHNPLRELPETVCDLFNLQTLKLVACDHLSKLPEGMGKLINLRHLEIERTERLKMLPKGIGGLSALRTLSKFFAGSSGDSEAAACKLGDLKNLNYLRGKLKIEGLGYVADAIEAEEAELKNKQHLLDLCLDFCPLVQVEGITGVFEALQLHPNLHYLQIKGYGGTKFPNWMLSLINLRKLQLQKCQNCERLPPLGRLPSLESLHIEDMDSLKSISLEFLGIGNCNDGGDNSEMTNDSTNSGTGASSSVVMAFPKLNKLKFVSMRGWEEWNVINTRREDIKIMPCLRCLKLSNCDKLEALPHCLLQMAPVKKLRIHTCAFLQERYKKGKGEDWSQISHIRKVHIS